MGYEHGKVTLCYEGFAQVASQSFEIIKPLASADLRNDLIKKGLRPTFVLHIWKQPHRSKE